MRIEPTTLTDIKSPALHSRAQIHARDEVILLRVTDRAAEVGVVILDFTSGDEGEAILVEIYVLPACRRRGVGTEALKLAEAFAQSHDCAWMTLDAEPLEDDDDDAKDKLMNWYRRHGYRVIGPYDHLRKKLTEVDPRHTPAPPEP